MSEDTKQQLWRELRYLQSWLSETPLGEALRSFERAWDRGQEVYGTLALALQLGADAIREDLRRARG